MVSAERYCRFMHGEFLGKGSDFDGGKCDEGEARVTDGEGDVETALYFVLATACGFELHFLTNALGFFVEGLVEGLHDVGFGDAAFLIDDAGYDDAPFELTIVDCGVLKVFEHEFVQRLVAAFELRTFQGLTLLTLFEEWIVPESEVKKLCLHPNGCGKK